MPIEKIFSEADIQTLIDMNSAPPFGQRNSALIIGAVYWGLTPTELSLLRLEDVMDQSGEFYRIWVLPKSVAYTGEERELMTADHVLPVFEKYMDWRIKNELFLTNIHIYRGSDPKSHFFLNDRFDSFKLSPKSKNESGYYLPRSMNEKLKQLISKTSIRGATPVTFRDSFIKLFYDAGCGYKELKLISGIKEKETLDKRIRPHERELEQVFSAIFSRVKFPSA